jgi:hypothetical protein
MTNGYVSADKRSVGVSNSDKKKLRTGIMQGGGPPPGYEWSVKFLPQAQAESKKILTKVQFEHIRMQFRDIASCAQPLKCSTVSIDQVEGFHELKDSGGVLGGKNVRVFFGIDKPSRSIVIFGVIVKQNNGPTPRGDRINIRNRWKRFNRGE